MKLRLKEDPREWCKSVLLTTLGLALVSSLLRWRNVVSGARWLEVLAVLGILSVAAALWPRSFRGYYRVSMRLGFATSQVIARVMLLLIFLVVITPMGLVFRLAGKDPLRLKRSRQASSYWSAARESSPLDRMF